MPPRTVVLAIVVLWLAAVGWLGYREWWAEPEPPGLLARADEVGTQYFNWRAWRYPPKGKATTAEGKGDNAGPGNFTLKRDRNSYLFKLWGVFTPNEDFTFRGQTVTALEHACRLTTRGRLRGLECKVVLGGHTVQLRGRLDGAGFTAEVRHGDAAPEQVVAEVPGSLLNLLQPLHRLEGLREGQRWQTAAFDPLEAAYRSRKGERGLPLRELEAAVTRDALEGWHEPAVPCWRVDYREGGQVRARVWARAGDGLVLRQEVFHDANTRTRLERDPERGAPIPKRPRGIP
jgi:hypothetical protein